MAETTKGSAKGGKKIVIEKDGPYQVKGGIRLVRKTQVVSEYGEPLTWQTTEVIPTEEEYELCRCGQSEDKPFCDSSHRVLGFDGTETADTDTTSERQQVYPGTTGIVVKRDMSVCVSSGFCGTRLANIRQLAARTNDPDIRARVMSMIEHCPSGSLTYALAKGQPDVEPEYAEEIAVVTEITNAGPIQGPLWVTGRIPIERSDGQPFETRNRVTLCRCGRSSTMPLCDASHRMKEE
jgi:CDGSH-type Zn-finger protein